MGIFSRKHKKPQETIDETRDPVCGMVVVPAKAIGPDVIAGQTYYFCSVGCQDRFHQERQGSQRRREGPREGLVH